MKQWRIFSTSFVEPAIAVILTAVAGSRRPVSAGAGKREKIRAVHGAIPSMAAFFISGALPCKIGLMGEGTVKPDFLPDGRLILSDCLGNGSLGGATADPGFDDLSFRE